MRTEIYESDPFTPQTGALLQTIHTDYRFERNDELFLTINGRRAKVRVIHIRVELEPEGLRREVLVLKL